jgi:hypothetical protein
MIVETGTGTPNADSYLSIAEADSLIHSSAWEAFSTEEKETALVEATKYLDLRYGDRYEGDKKSEEQGLDLPRVSKYLGSLIFPREIKLATAEVSNLIASGVDVYETESKFGSIQSEKSSIGPISEEVVYVGSKSAMPYFPKISLLMNRITMNSNLIERA